MEKEMLLKGLEGFLKEGDEQADWERVTSVYQYAGQDTPDHVREQLQK